MFLEGILAISGEPGLFKLVSKGKTNVIVESLLNGKRMPVFSTSNISTLEDVAIYTENEDVPLRKVFLNIFEKYNGETVLTGKPSNKELMELLGSILPDYDRDRVYASDAKKMVNWYNCLITNKILTKENIKEEEKEEINSEE
ncbi:MAG: DUF5606 domain-containing protein [Bacteroidales bacterium]|jgi:hypothetical protein|nr:DUF5606 domain-containing protein [Bacteroidales bacterium]